MALYRPLVGMRPGVVPNEQLALTTGGNNYRLYLSRGAATGSGNGFNFQLFLTAVSHFDLSGNDIALLDLPEIMPFCVHHNIRLSACAPAKQHDQNTQGQKVDTQTTLGWGLVYLALYNLLFILPLIVILLVAGNRIVAKQLATWEREHALALRLWFGVTMIGLGAAMLWMVIPGGTV